MIIQTTNDGKSVYYVGAMELREIVFGESNIHEMIFKMDGREKDFVQVVRCKDCEYFHRRQSMFGKEYTECDLYCAMQPGEEDYCSRGRLKNVQNVQ